MGKKKKAEEEGGLGEKEPGGEEGIISASR